MWHLTRSGSMKIGKVFINTKKHMKKQQKDKDFNEFLFWITNIDGKILEGSDSYNDMCNKYLNQ